MHQLFSRDWVWLEEFVSLERLRLRSWDTVERELVRFLKELHGDGRAVHEVGSSEVLRVMGLLHAHNSFKTLRQGLGYVRGWYRWMYRQDKILAPIHSKLQVRGKVTRALPQVLSKEQVDLWFQHARSCEPEGFLDWVMLETVYGCGLRAGELYNLRRQDIDLGCHTLFIRKSKTNRQRLIPLPKGTAEALQSYLSTRVWGLSQHSALWVRENGERVPNHHLKYRIKTYHKQHLPFGNKLSLRTLRHTYATHLLEAGANVRHIQKLLGHVDIDTTTIYTQVDLESLRRVLRTAQPKRLRTRK